MVQRRKYALLKQPFELDALGDISLTNPVLGDVLYYDGSFWINTPYAELVDDRVAALLVAGNNIDITYNDGAGTITIDVEALSTADLTDASSIAMLNQTEVITGFWTFTDYVQIDSATGASFWFQTSGAALNEKWWGFDGSTGGDFTLQLCADNGTGYKTAIQFTRGSGAVLAGIDYGNSTDNPAHTFYGAVTINGNVTLGTDNVLTFDEHSTAPGTPAAGKVVVYAKADGKLYIKDDAGTETDLTATSGGGGDVATDAIWDAAGDLVVGTGANTASRLAIGSEGQVLSVSSGAVAWADPSGSDGNLSAEILADSPMAYWKCNETSGTTLDNAQGTAAYDLTLSGTYTLAHTFLMKGSSDKGLYISDSAAYAGVSGDLGFSPPITGDWTFECLVIPMDLSTLPCRLFAISGSGETEATNYQFAVSIATTGIPQVFWEYGAGTNQTTASGLTLRSGEIYHLAVQKDGTANTITFFINGRKLAVVSYTNEPSGGTDASVVTRIGADGTSTTGAFIIGHVAVWASTLSEQRIFDHATAAGRA